MMAEFSTSSIDHREIWQSIREYCDNLIKEINNNRHNTSSQELCHPPLIIDKFIKLGLRAPQNTKSLLKFYDNFIKCDDSNNGEIHSGWLYKKGVMNRAWQKRYFVLKSLNGNKMIDYFKDKSHSKPKGTIYLSQIERIELMQYKNNNIVNKLNYTFTSKWLLTEECNDEYDDISLRRITPSSSCSTTTISTLSSETSVDSISSQFVNNTISDIYITKNGGDSNKPYSFSLIQPNPKREWILAAECKQELNEWINVLINKSITNEINSVILTESDINNPYLFQFVLNDDLVSEISQIVTDVLEEPQNNDNENGCNPSKQSTSNKSNNNKSNNGSQSNGGNVGSNNDGCLNGNGSGDDNRRNSDEDKKYRNKYGVNDDDEENEEKKDEENDEDEEDEKLQCKLNVNAATFNPNQLKPIDEEKEDEIEMEEKIDCKKKKRNKRSKLKYKNIVKYEYSPNDFHKGPADIIITKKLTQDVIPCIIKEEISNIFDYVYKSVVLQKMDEFNNGKIRIFNLDFHDKKTNEILYCMANKIDPKNNRKYKWKMKEKLFSKNDEKLRIYQNKLPKSLRESNWFKLDEMKLIENEINNNNSSQSIIDDTRWCNIDIFSKQNNKRRVTLSLTKTVFQSQMKYFIDSNYNKNSNVLIPILMFKNKGYDIHYLWIIKIDIESDTDIGIALKYEYENNNVYVVGIHINKQYILQQHELIDIEHECQCLDGFTSIFNELRIGNPDKYINQNKDLLKRMKHLNDENKELKYNNKELQQQIENVNLTHVSMSSETSISNTLSAPISMPSSNGNQYIIQQHQPYIIQQPMAISVPLYSLPFYYQNNQTPQ